MENIISVPLKLIVADPVQPRQEYNVSEMKLLEKSIATKGVMSPLAVEKMPGKNTYLLVDGERRFRAATAVGLKEVPVIVYEEMNDKERIMVRFHLQEQHSNWSSFDKARAIATLQQANDMSSKEVADLLGLNIKTVQDYLMLLSLSKRTIKIANEAKIPYSYLSEIATLKRQIKEVTLRNPLEESLVEKVKAGVIVRASEIYKYRAAINAKGDAMIKKIIDTPNMSGEGAMQFAGIDVQVRSGRLIFQAKYVANALQKMKNEGVVNDFTKEQLAALEHLSDVIASIV